MFIACGVGAYQAGIFHLFTHAFFKAMLFLAAGSVIHATHEQDINKMGGLKNKMPITYTLFIIGSLAIMGIYPLSGFYSKDLVLVSAYLAGTDVANLAWKLGMFAAFCTAIYSMKILIKVFHGKPHSPNSESNMEPGFVMIYPLHFLALGSIGAGYLFYKILNIKTPISGFFKSAIFVKDYNGGMHAPMIIELLPLFF